LCSLLRQSFDVFIGRGVFLIVEFESLGHGDYDVVVSLGSGRRLGVKDIGDCVCSKRNILICLIKYVTVVCCVLVRSRYRSK